MVLMVDQQMVIQIFGTANNFDYKIFHTFDLKLIKFEICCIHICRRIIIKIVTFLSNMLTIT